MENHNEYGSGSHNPDSIARGMLWKLLERFGVMGTQFVLQIILARLLDPAHYGALSIMIIFTSLANVFIQTGFNTSLIQNKDVTEEDYSSVLWVSLAVAGVLYGVIFFAAPLIGQFYAMPEIVNPLRVLALMLFPGALNSVQLAKVSRELDFRKVFFSNLGAMLVSGIAGICIAYMGGGLWALVAQNLLNTTVACIVMRFTVKMKIRLACNFSRIKVLFSFGYKLLLSTLLDTLYRDLHSLVIGKKYTSDALGYYTRGQQFPSFLISAIDGSVKSVMLPTMSAMQDNKDGLKQLMRSSLTLSAYIIFPVMFGLAAVAEPLVSLLLTDKWLPCVPYMQIYCFSFAFYPVHSCNLQAINAMGRSDLYLKLEIIKKSYGMLTLLIAVFFFDSPLAIAMTGIFTTLISCFVNASPNKKLIQYAYAEQMLDVLPIFGISVVMFFVVRLANNLSMSNVALLVVEVLLGVVVYLLLSVIVCSRQLNQLIGQVKRFKR